MKRRNSSVSTVWRRDKNRSVFAILCVALFISASFGCASSSKIQPLLSLERRSVAFVPFSFQERRLGESKAGIELAQLVAKFLSQSVKEIKIVSEKPAEKLFYGKKIENVEWQKVAFSICPDGADFVITGHINQFQTRSPKQVGLYEGNAEVFVYVFDKDGRQVLAQRVNATYPFRQISAPVDTFEMSEEEFLGRLMARTALLISRLFYEYSAEEE